MGAYAWLLNKQASEGCDKSNQHKRLQCAHQGHHPWTESKFNTYVVNWFTEKLNWNMLDQTEIFILSKKKKKNYLHICVYSAAKQKNWKSKVVSETEQVLVPESAETAQGTNEVQKPWTNSFKPDREKQRLNSRVSRRTHRVGPKIQ